MADVKHGSSGSWDFQIDQARVSTLFDDELVLARQNLSEAWVNDIEDVRTSAIAWAARFLPEALSPSFRTKLTNLVMQTRARTSFRVDLWDRCLPLDVALYCLTGDYDWLQLALARIDQGRSTERSWVLESLSLVADRLRFDDWRFLTRVANNISNNNLFCDWSVMLVAVSRGDANEKRDLFLGWREEYADNPIFSVGPLLKRLCDGDPVENPFLHHFLRTQQYVIVRLASAYALPPSQLAFPLDVTNGASDSTQLPKTEVITGSMLWQRLHGHPLTESHITLEKS